MHNDNQPLERPRHYFSQKTRTHTTDLTQQRPRPTQTIISPTAKSDEAMQPDTHAPMLTGFAATDHVGPPDETNETKKETPLSASDMARKRANKKQLILFGAIGATLVLCASAGAYITLHRYKPPVKPAAVAKKYVAPPSPTPTTVASTLSGLPVSPDVNKRPVTAVMIENSPDARPQSGLDQASVVFEAQAEGGVTRFAALYQDTQPNYLGPVRSARVYYIQWMLGFDAAYAHVGGAPDALQDITSWHVKDLNEFYNAGAYERISSRYAPHNVYTSIAQLNQIETSKGFTTSTFTGFPRKAEAPSKTPNATSIDVTFSGYYYNAHYDYNATNNTYKRSEAGAAHMELNKDGSTVQIAPKVIVAMVVPLSQGALDASGAYYSNYATIGSGTAYVFQDGVEQTGTWTKTSNTSQITFTDSTGKPLALNPGQTWIEAIANTNDIAYK